MFNEVLRHDQLKEDLVASIYIFISYRISPGWCLSYYYFQLTPSVDMCLLLLAFLFQIFHISPNSKYFLLHVCLYGLYIHIDSYNCDYYISDDDHNGGRSVWSMLLKFLLTQFLLLPICTSSIQDVCQNSTATTFAEYAYISYFYLFEYSSALPQHHQHFLMRNS